MPAKNKIMRPLVLRAGVIYGSGVKLTEAARWLMRKRLLAVWRKPTWIHLLALPDFLTLVDLSIERDNLSGIYNLCDDCPLLIQEFLDRLRPIGDIANLGACPPLPSTGLHPSARTPRRFCARTLH